MLITQLQDVIGYILELCYSKAYKIRGVNANETIWSTQRK